MRTRHASISIIVAAFATGLTGCFVVSDAHLKALMDSGPGDGTVVMPDAGVAMLDDLCGVNPAARTLSVTTTNMMIDTTNMHGNVALDCPPTMAPTNGNDAFIHLHINSTAEHWHFHLSTTDTTRNPALYVLPASGGNCNDRDCSFISDVCSMMSSTVTADEHFAFLPTAAGDYYVGVDDRNSGGGVYTLSAYQLLHDGMQIHGEGCDLGSPSTDPSTCTNAGEQVLNAGNTAEHESNDTIPEANYLQLDGGGMFTVTGLIGGGCRYPDIFAVDVPANANVTVTMLDTGGAPCTNPSLTAGYALNLKSTNGSSPAATYVDGSTSCAALQTTSPLAAGHYYIFITAREESMMVYQYTMRVRVGL